MSGGPAGAGTQPGNSPGGSNPTLTGGSDAANIAAQKRAAKAAADANRLRSAAGAPWSWAANGGDEADLSDFYWAGGLGNSRAESRRLQNGHVVVGNPSDGWYDPKAPYGRDAHGKPINVRPQFDDNAIDRLTGRTKNPGLPPGVQAAPGSSYVNAEVETAFLHAKDPSEVQTALLRGGFYGSSNKPTVGLISADDQPAFHLAYQVYMQSRQPGESFKDWLGARGDARDKLGAAPLQRLKPTITLSDPMALRGAFDATASKVLGRNLHEDEIQKYINEIHSGETSTAVAADNANPKYYNPNPAGSGPVTPPPPDPGGTIVDQGSSSPGKLEEMYKRDHPAEAQATTMGENGAAILSIMQRHLAGADSVGR